MRKLLPLFAFALALAFLNLTATAQDAPDQAMLEKLFGSHEDLASLKAALKEAEEKKLHQQTLDEALFLYHIRSETESELAQHIERFEKGVASYDPKNAIITQQADEWEALVTFCRAIDAANKSDTAGFKKLILEAYWLSPGHGEVFAGPIQKMRNLEAMGKIVVDFDTPLLDAEGEPATLAPLIKDRKAILIDFWASWCGPCMQLMPQLQVKADLLAKHDIAVVGMNTEADPTTANAVKNSQKMKLPWLVEPDTEPFSQLFRIDSIPRMVLISPEGKVLYNGHPNDPKLWVELKKIAPDLSEPEEGAGEEEETEEEEED